MEKKELEKLAKRAGLNKQEMETLVTLESLSKGITSRLTTFLEAKILVQENVTPFVNPTDDVQGLINFALTQNSQEVGINPEEPHMLIVGQTGAGKTTLLLRILSEILKNEE